MKAQHTKTTDDVTLASHPVGSVHAVHLQRVLGSAKVNYALGIKARVRGSNGFSVGSARVAKRANWPKKICWDRSKLSEKSPIFADVMHVLARGDL